MLEFAAAAPRIGLDEDAEEGRALPRSAEGGALTCASSRMETLRVT